MTTNQTNQPGTLTVSIVLAVITAGGTPSERYKAISKTYAPSQEDAQILVDRHREYVRDSGTTYCYRYIWQPASEALTPNPAPVLKARAV